MSIKLGLDASQSVASCAVSIDGNIAASAVSEKPIETFIQLMKSTLDKVNLEIKDVDEIVVCIGPGSQMGVRTAIVTGNALAMALNVPISSVYSVDAGAVLVEDDTEGEFCFAVPAGRSRWYTEKYERKNGVIKKMNQLLLVDEVPDSGCISLKYDIHSYDEKNTCACGALKIANQCEELIVQLRAAEITPVEF